MKQIAKSLFTALTAVLCWYVLHSTIAVGAETSKSANFAGDVSAAVSDKVRDALTAPGRDIESIRPEVPKSYADQKEYDAIDVTIPTQGRVGERMIVGVTLSKDGQPVSRLNVPVVIKMTMEVAVAAADIKKGVPLSDRDLVMEKRPAGAGMEKYVTEIADATGKQLDRSVRAGTIIRSDQLQTPKLVSAGSPVVITADTGTIKITTMGKAKQDGDKGEWIKVVNTDSRKTIDAKVIGPGEVSVEF